MTTTTAPAKPRRRRAKRARKPATVTMNQQTPLKVEIPAAPRTRPDVQWQDYQNRMKIHDYELAEAMSDLKKLAAWTNDSIKKLLKRIDEVDLLLHVGDGSGLHARAEREPGPARSSRSTR